MNNKGRLEEEEDKVHPSGAEEAGSDASGVAKPKAPKEVGGTQGPEPTRYGDWSHKGIASDF